MTRTIPWLAAALLALGGCNKKSENPPPPISGSGNTMTAGSDAPSTAGTGSAAPNAAGSGSSAPTAAAPAADPDVPTEMDFENDATAKITDKNVEAQVQAIEKELEQK